MLESMLFDLPTTHQNRGNSFVARPRFSSVPLPEDAHAHTCRDMATAKSLDRDLHCEGRSNLTRAMGIASSQNALLAMTSGARLRLCSCHAAGVRSLDSTHSTIMREQMARSRVSGRRNSVRCVQSNECDNCASDCKKTVRPLTLVTQ